MQIGKFTFQKRKWYYKDRELANPLVIIWRIIWLIPKLVSVAVYACIVTIYSLDVSEFERVWEEFY